MTGIPASGCWLSSASSVSENSVLSPEIGSAMSRTSGSRGSGFGARPKRRSAAPASSANRASAAVMPWSSEAAQGRLTRSGISNRASPSKLTSGRASGRAVKVQTGPSSAPSIASVPDCRSSNSCIGSIGAVTSRPETVSDTESRPSGS